MKGETRGDDGKIKRGDGDGDGEINRDKRDDGKISGDTRGVRNKEGDAGSKRGTN